MKTEDKLIQRTIKLIAQQGYQDLSLRKLTKAIGLTTGAFYKHFASKDELLEKTAQDLSANFIAGVPLQKNQSAKEQLLIIAKYFCVAVTKTPHVMDFLFFSPVVSPAYQTKNNNYAFLTKVQQLVKEVNTKSRFSNQQLFLQVWSFIQGYAYLIKNRITYYDANLVESTLNEFLRGK